MKLVVATTYQYKFMLYTKILKLRSQHWCTKCELQVHIGFLNHTASVIGTSGTSTRGHIEALSAASALYCHVRLNTLVWANPQWWNIFLETLNGISFMVAPYPACHILSNTSGSWECGTIWALAWIRMQWPSDSIKMCFRNRELCTASFKSWYYCHLSQLQCNAVPCQWKAYRGLLQAPVPLFFSCQSASC